MSCRRRARILATVDGEALHRDLAPVGKPGRTAKAACSATAAHEQRAFGFEGVEVEVDEELGDGSLRRVAEEDCAVARYGVCNGIERCLQRVVDHRGGMAGEGSVNVRKSAVAGMGMGMGMGVSDGAPAVAVDAVRSTPRVHSRQLEVVATSLEPRRHGDTEAGERRKSPCFRVSLADLPFLLHDHLPGHRTTCFRSGQRERGQRRAASSPFRGHRPTDRSTVRERAVRCGSFSSGPG